ncbi:MAG: purine-nucleoside phosphorylase [Bacilli bacterium]|jgi:purine-nucleoside phosphorylase
MATPHIEALEGDIAEVVLMPGDPLRAKFIADNYLTDVKMINKVRNMLGFTGYYKGKKVTVMGSGMGIPSIGIYAYELFKFYNVKKIIRLGSCGGYAKELKLYDIILATSSFSESSFAYAFNGYKGNITKPSEKLNQQIEDAAKKLGIKLYKGTILSSDAFYNEEYQLKTAPKELKVIATEMEAFGLFHIAKSLNKEAACLLTVVKSFITNESASSKEREQSLGKMIELALESL